MPNGGSYQIHVTVDGLGNPLRLAVTAEQAADLHEAIPLVAGLAFERLIADRGYAAQAFYDWVVAQEFVVFFPAMTNLPAVFSVFCNLSVH